MRHCDLERLHAAHREARHRAMFTVGERAERAVDGRDQVVDHHLLEGREDETERAPRPRWLRRLLTRFHRVTFVHDNDHRHSLLRGDQVVQDQVRAPLFRPARLILAAAVLQVQHGIPRLQIVVVIRWRVHERPPPRRHRLRVVAEVAHLSVWRVLHRVIVHPRLWNLDAAELPPHPEERVATRVRHRHAVHPQLVIVEPRHLRRNLHRPHPVGAHRHVVLLGHDVHLDLLRVRRLQAERRAQIRVHLRVLRVHDV